jgi:MerR family copper efflux transcriptional regulator
MARVPIACSLTADDADVREDEWQQFLRYRVVEVVRSARSARLRLQDGDDSLLVATDLARREKACCPFFEFRLVLLPEAVWLEVEAPDEAVAILDALVDLRRS